MRNVAYIPVRGGSKSIPLKNIKQIAGKPLVYWAVKAACECPEIDRVYVSTDSVVIGETVKRFSFEKVEIIGRSAESSTDTASTEHGMIEFAKKYVFENVVLIQATSPLLASRDLSAGFKVLAEADSVLSVVRQKRFIWRINGDGFASTLNYDFTCRPRRQEFEGFIIENGAFYMISRTELLRTGNRLSGKIKAVEMPPDTYFETDEPEDWLIVEALLKKRNTSADIPKIKMFLCDCDGTLTDGGMFYSENGEMLKKFNTRDGVGLRLLQECGIITGIITGENSEIVRKRAEKLCVDEILTGISDKIGAITLLCEKYNVDIAEVAYIGDDLNDMDAINLVGFGACTNDAIPIVKNISRLVTSARGGDGAVREVADYILSGGTL